MKNLLLLFTLFITVGFAQTKQTVIVKNKFDFQNSANEYNVNTMFKSVLESCNYEVLFDDQELTKAQSENQCSLLQGNLVQKSTMFKTSLQIQFIDCYKKVVFETPFVESKEKEYQTAYISLMKLLQPELKKRIVKPLPIILKDEKSVDYAVLSETEAKQFLVKKTTTGFELYDVTDKQMKNLQFTAFNTTNLDVYLVKSNTDIQVEALIVNNKGAYTLEYLKNGKLEKQKMVINF